MTARPRIAFYAPLKSPDHPDPSGDRTMARLLSRTLGEAGFEVALASRLRTLDKAGERSLQEALRERSLAEAGAILASIRDGRSPTPSLWFTYHVHYKAPDWIGPLCATRLGIPYVVAEGTRARKRAGGPWALAHEGAEAALDRADLVFALTPRDRIALDRWRPAHQRIADLPPFMDWSDWPEPPERKQRNPGAPRRLVAVAMMRDGAKLASYRLLAQTFAALPAGRFTLDIVGAGPAEGEIRALFAPFGSTIRFRGLVASKPALAAVLADADLFVWPAVDEAYGMAPLEAQGFGLPVVAGDHGGIEAVVRHRETGVLTPPNDASALAEAVAALASDPSRLAELGRNALRFARTERGAAAAAALLAGELTTLLPSRSVASERLSGG